MTGTLPVRLATAWALFQGLLLEALPFLLIGVLIASLARWFSPGGQWLRRLPAHPIAGPLSGAALGFALPACECGNVPVARRLLVAGAPVGTALGFLFAAPVLNPIVLASTWAAFPDQPWLLLARPFGAVLVALSLALLLRLLPEADLLRAEVLEERRLSQPLASVSLLERRSGVIGLPAEPAGGDAARQPGVPLPRPAAGGRLRRRRVGAEPAAAPVAPGRGRRTHTLGGGADAAQPGAFGVLQRGRLSRAGFRRAGHSRGAAGLPAAGPCDRREAGGSAGAAVPPPWADAHHGGGLPVVLLIGQWVNLWRL
jgi:hypothetical protein